MNTDEADRVRYYIHKEYSLLPSYGVTIKPVDYDAYGGDCIQMFNDIDSNRQLKVFTGGTCPSYLSESLNVKFRAIHDWHHYKVSADFTFTGEYSTYQYAAQVTTTVSDRFIRQFLFSEIVAQAAAYAYLEDYPKEQKLVLFDFIH